ncbi:MAG: AraC family transcriptional regulator [Gemmatimonadaceae bacterium]
MRDAGSMENPRALARLVRIRTADWPERDRIEMFREMHGRGQIHVEPRPNEPLWIDALLVRFPELGLLHGRRSPLKSEFADGSDRLMLNLGGPAVATQFGRELVLERGDAIALSGSDPGSLTTLQTGRVLTLDFPQGKLLPLLEQPQRNCARRIPKHSLPLRLLRGYIRAALTNDGVGAASLPQLAIAHIYDLAAMAVGAGREAEEIANGRGVRAGRLHAIKADILARLENDLSLGEVAARHRLSARYVGMLFESEGMSMTEFVREERLKRARSMLLSPRFAGRRIAEVAYEVGFNDLSYFNRSFRRRFGVSPREVRELGMSDNS